MSFDIDDDMVRGQQKELTVEGCCMLLIDAVLERFGDFAVGLITEMIRNSYSSIYDELIR